MLKLPKLDSKYVKEESIKFIKEIIEKSKSEKAIIGISGGIDSTVVAYLLKEALGEKNVLGYHLYSETTPKEDTDHARLIANQLNISYTEIAIDNISNEFIDTINQSQSENSKNNKLDNKLDNKLAIGNLKARIRMSILYYFANLNNGLVAGTGNKSELLIGYFTKHGDGACDFELIGDIYKTQLKQLATNWNIPNEIITKPPRAGLWIDQSDEDEIGMTYELLDNILHLIEDKKLDDDSILKEINVSSSEINNVRSKIAINQHKTQIPLTPFMSKKLL
ncbi:NAD+ synthase [Methanobrevibacter filiformis]|nr:NAD+ synthase [Methanobrevibacter filiformis]